TAHRVHHGVKPPMPPHNSFDKFPHRPFIGHIHSVAVEVRRVARSEILQAIELFLLSIGDNDTRTVLQERQTYGPSQSPRTSSHQHHSSCRCHVRFHEFLVSRYSVPGPLFLKQLSRSPNIDHAMRRRPPHDLTS